MNENMYNDIPQEPEKAKKKGSAKWPAILLSILTLTLVGQFSEQIVSFVMDRFSANNLQKQFEQYAKQVMEYVPGTLTEDSYTSEYWDLKFQTGDGWEMIEEEERKAISDEAYEAAKTIQTSILQTIEPPEDIREAVQNSFYGADEMIAVNLNEEGYCVGVAQLLVMQLFGMPKGSEKDLLKEFVSHPSGQIEEISIGNSTHPMVTSLIETGEPPLLCNNILIAKGDSICVLQISHPVGDDHIFTSFMEHLSPCP